MNKTRFSQALIINALTTSFASAFDRDFEFCEWVRILDSCNPNSALIFEKSDCSDSYPLAILPSQDGPERKNTYTEGSAIVIPSGYEMQIYSKTDGLSGEKRTLNGTGECQSLGDVKVDEFILNYRMTNKKALDSVKTEITNLWD